MKKLLLLMVSAFFVACVQQPETAKDPLPVEEDKESLLSVPADASVFFVNLKDGDTLSVPQLIEFGVNGMNVQPAGELVEGTGHHHIIIDKTFIAQGETVPADEQHIHFGGGQTETELSLTPGAHTLTLQFADGLHKSYGEQMANTINVFVPAE